jgi:hypothetical protein
VVQKVGQLLYMGVLEYHSYDARICSKGADGGLGEEGDAHVTKATSDGFGVDVLLAGTALHPVGHVFGGDWRGHIGWERCGEQLAEQEDYIYLPR